MRLGSSCDLRDTPPPLHGGRGGVIVPIVWCFVLYLWIRSECEDFLAPFFFGIVFSEALLSSMSIFGSDRSSVCRFVDMFDAGRLKTHRTSKRH